MTDNIASCFTRAFAVGDGKRVLEHLEKHFPEMTERLPAEDLHYYAGQRSVIRFIHKLIEKGRGNE